MNPKERNKGVTDENAVTIELLNSLPDFKNCSDEELCRISESLKEFCLLLHQLSKDGDDQGHES